MALPTRAAMWDNMVMGDNVATGQSSAVGACETNLSMLFFTPDRVYKVLKPVTTPFVDFSDTTARLEATTLEFETNRRISPDVYLDVVDLSEHGRTVDRMIIMRRMPSSGELTVLLQKGQTANTVQEVARFLAGFHSSLEPIHDQRSAVASVEAIAKNWNDNLSTIDRFVGSVLDRDAFEEVEELQRAYIDGRRALFEKRRELGWIRDGHGDLRSEHIYRTAEGWRLIDCVAFRDDLRISDVLADIAFLAMDLHRLAGVDAAITLMRTWDAFTNEHHPSSLAHFYVAYRAHVRCKIECLRLASGHDDAADSARLYHQLALEHLRLSRVRLVVVGGGAGTGKSTISAGVAKRMGAVWLRSDEIRKDIASVAHDEHAFAQPGAGIYSCEFSEAMNDEVIRRTELLLTRGCSVVLDATWSDSASRARVRRLAQRTKTGITEIRCKVAPAIAKERIARRMSSVHNPSDATPDLVDYIESRFEPWPEAAELSTAQSVQASIDSACALVGGTASSAESTKRFDMAITAAGFTAATAAPRI